MCPHGAHQYRGSRPIATAERRASLSKSAYRRLSRALGGLEARRGLWVKGEMREPKCFQCSGTRRSSLRGHRIGISDHACQYSFAAWASISLTRSMVSAFGSSSRVEQLCPPLQNRAACRVRVTSCPASFWEISSLEILIAVPLPSASACALRSLASDGATGPVTASTLPLGQASRTLRPRQKSSEGPQG